jgi:hypothetical protein
VPAFLWRTVEAAMEQSKRQAERRKSAADKAKGNKKNAAAAANGEGGSDSDDADLLGGAGGEGVDVEADNNDGGERDQAEVVAGLLRAGLSTQEAGATPAGVNHPTGGPNYDWHSEPLADLNRLATKAAADAGEVPPR